MLDNLQQNLKAHLMSSLAGKSSEDTSKQAASAILSKATETKLETDVLNPEAMRALARLGGAQVSADQQESITDTVSDLNDTPSGH